MNEPTTENAPFQIGDRVEFHQLASPVSHGVVIDIRHGIYFGQPRWDIRVQYDEKNIPRWTHPQWLRIESAS